MLHIVRIEKLNRDCFCPIVVTDQRVAGIVLHFAQRVDGLIGWIMRGATHDLGHIHGWGERDQKMELVPVKDPQTFDCYEIRVGFVVFNASDKVDREFHVVD
jgi:hypothetical protein